MKKFKTKKQNNYKNFIIMAIVFAIFLLIFIFVSSNKLNKSYKLFINYLLKEEHIVKEKNNKPITYLINNLDYLINNYAFVEKIEDVIVIKENKPLVYIYNTHDSEEYKNESNNNSKTNVKTASMFLKNGLLKYNIFSIVEEKSVYKEIKNNNYNDSYKISRKYLEEAILNNDSLNYFIDIHRDSVNKNYTEIILNNKEYAKIMFVLGLENKNYLENKSLMIKLNNYLNNNYPGISRGIYEKKGSGVNGVYNQDFHKNVILIEIGGVDNNLDSVFNSTQIIAEALYHIIGEDNEKTD